MNIKAVAECKKNAESKKILEEREIRVSKTLERSERARCALSYDAGRENRIMHAVQSSQGVRRQVRAFSRDEEKREKLSARR